MNITNFTGQYVRIWQPKTQGLDVIFRSYWQTATVLNSYLNQPNFWNCLALIAYLDIAFALIGNRDQARIGQDGVSKRLFSYLQEENDEHRNDGYYFGQMVNNVIVIYHYISPVSKTWTLNIYH